MLFLFKGNKVIGKDKLPNKLNWSKLVKNLNVKLSTYVKINIFQSKKGNWKTRAKACDQKLKPTLIVGNYYTSNICLIIKNNIKCWLLLKKDAFECRIKILLKIVPSENKNLPLNCS